MGREAGDRVFTDATELAHQVESIIPGLFWPMLGAGRLVLRGKRQGKLSRMG